MTDRPLGIADLALMPFESGIDKSVYSDHWYWCRRHTQSVKVGEFCSTTDEPPEGGKRVVVHVAESCIRIGPFMSEREANRLGGTVAVDGNEKETRLREPLGMEVEK